MTMTEIVAKRIHQDQTTGRSWESEAETMKQFYRKCASSAIAAMREPTGAMLGAGSAAVIIHYSPEKGEGVDGVSVDESWRAMIDEALK